MTDHRWVPPWEIRRSTLEHRQAYARQVWRDAALYLAMHKGGPISNSQLAEALGLDPRGLRVVLARRPEFILEIRGNNAEKARGVPYYRLNPDAMHDAPEPDHQAILEVITSVPRIECSVVEEKQNKEK